MVCLGLEPRVACWKGQTNPLSYSGTPMDVFLCITQCLYFVDYPMPNVLNTYIIVFVKHLLHMPLVRLCIFKQM